MTVANSAHAVAVETLRNPTVQRAVGALLDAEGISDRKLTEIHARYLALYASDDAQEKALGLKALDMVYKLKGAYAPERHRIEPPRTIDPEAIDRLIRAFQEDRARQAP